jgi:type VI protein secretion system component VasK
MPKKELFPRFWDEPWVGLPENLSPRWFLFIQILFPIVSAICLSLIFWAISLVGSGVHVAINSLLFWGILLSFWASIWLLLVWLRYSNRMAQDKKIDELIEMVKKLTLKQDELINEIRQDREERKNKEKKKGGEYADRRKNDQDHNL